MMPDEVDIDMLRKEIELILERNRNATYLKSLLTHALILEKLYKK